MKNYRYYCGKLLGIFFNGVYFLKLCSVGACLHKRKKARFWGLFVWPCMQPMDAFIVFVDWIFWFGLGLNFRFGLASGSDEVLSFSELQGKALKVSSQVWGQLYSEPSGKARAECPPGVGVCWGGPACAECWGNKGHNSELCSSRAGVRKIETQEAVGYGSFEAITSGQVALDCGGYRNSMEKKDPCYEG